MTRDTLSRLLGLAKEKKDAAALRLTKSLALVRESQSRLELLERYREEYRGKLRGAGSQGMSSDELRNFRGFLAKLDEAIAQQAAEVEALKKGATDCQGRWQAERRREKSFDVLAGRADERDRAGEAKRLQKMIDEFALRDLNQGQST